MTAHLYSAGGNIFHGAMGLDSLFLMRPVKGWYVTLKYSKQSLRFMIMKFKTLLDCETGQITEAL